MIHYAILKHTQQIVIISYKNDLIIIDKKGNYNNYHKYYPNNIHAYKSVQMYIDEKKLNNKTYVKCLYNRIINKNDTLYNSQTYPTDNNSSI